MGQRVPLPGADVSCACLYFFSLRQVPVDGNALFSAVAMSRWFIESGEHSVVSSPEIEMIAKDLRQVRFVARYRRTARLSHFRTCPVLAPVVLRTSVR